MWIWFRVGNSVGLLRTQWWAFSSIKVGNFLTSSYQLWKKDSASSKHYLQWCGSFRSSSFYIGADEIEHPHAKPRFIFNQFIGCCLVDSAWKMEAVGSLEALIPIYQLAPSWVDKRFLRLDVTFLFFSFILPTLFYKIFRLTRPFLGVVTLPKIVELSLQFSRMCNVLLLQKSSLRLINSIKCWYLLIASSAHCRLCMMSVIRVLLRVWGYVWRH
jgi:hypothetical protein